MKQNIHVISLGCAKNLIDSERLMYRLDRLGFELFHNQAEVEAATTIINTCGFISSAQEESINTILEAVEQKKEGKTERVYVFGCLSEKYRLTLQKEIPEVDKFYGKFDWEAMTELLSHVSDRKDLSGTHSSVKSFENRRYITTPSHYAYLKISEGCNRSCAFCAIPGIVGKHRSKSIEALVSEANLLAEQGVKELLLIAQDSSMYGYDLYKRHALPELLRKLSEVNGIEWIKLHYVYPAGFPMETLQEIQNNPKVCRYLDVPLQHISDHVLSLMKRRITSNETRKFIDQVRTNVPQIHLRTTLLVGHPGEREEDFQELLDFLKWAKFERMGSFSYSHEDGTYSAKNYTDDLPPEVKKERLERLMEVQQEISFNHNQTKIGEQVRVLIDRKEQDLYIGRTEFDSPEVDGEVLISDKHGTLEMGNFYNIKVTNATEFDLEGIPLL